MKRTFLIATLFIVLLFGGSMAIVVALTRPERMPAAPEAQLDPPITIAPAPAPAPLAAASAAPASASDGGWYGGGRARATSKAPSEPSAAPTPSRLTLKAIHKALSAAPLQARLARCVPAAAVRAPRTQPASLMLEIETLEGELRIVDAQVRAWGGASEAMVSCARSVLRGHVFPAPAHRRPAAHPRPAGERMQVPFLLNPRSEAVVSSR
jgi:hypothetical protein